jgi:hypothetical protein
LTLDYLPRKVKAISQDSLQWLSLRTMGTTLKTASVVMMNRCRLSRDDLDVPRLATRRKKAKVTPRAKTRRKSCSQMMRAET